MTFNPKLHQVAFSFPNKDLQKFKKLLTTIGFQFKPEDSKEVLSQKINEENAHVISQDCELNLLIPMALKTEEKPGPVHKFLDKGLKGFHHIAFIFQPGDLVKLRPLLLKEGFEFTHEEDFPSLKSDGTGNLVNFVHPKTTGGVLVELCEPIV